MGDASFRIVWQINVERIVDVFLATIEQASQPKGEK
jgi:hypothetical protein